MDSPRVAILKTLLPSSPNIDAAIAHAVLGSSSSPPPGISPALMKKAVLANAVLDISNDNEELTRHVLQNPELSTLRDVAFKYDPKLVASLAASGGSGSGSGSGDNHQDDPSSAQTLNEKDFQARLFHAEPSAVIHRMVSDNQIPLPPDVRSGVTTFFEKQPDFNIRKTSVVNAVAEPGAFDGVPEGHIPNTINHLKTLQRVQALAPHPEAIPELLKAGITSAHQVAQMPKSRFVKKVGDALGVGAAKQIHGHALASSARNDQALLQIFQTIKGAGVAAIDGTENMDTRMAILRAVADKNNVNISLESLFGGLDFCQCDDCTTVVSPANYFVELLQYLRNNDLDLEEDPNSQTSPKALKYPNTGQPGIDGTALQALLRRRPDLQHLQLTCENANTLIPYLDLANEVMESFVVHNPKSWSVDSQAVIDVFNIHDETSNEVLAEPQHTNYKAYCLLREAVYPLGILPFHQPLAAIRIYLQYLKASRHEILDIFRKPYVTPVATPPFSSDDDQKLSNLHDEIIDRAVAAEYLSIIQEEYIILTKEAFWPKDYFAITSRNPVTDTVYDKKIGLRDWFSNWGYDTAANALGGLSEVKAQFLTRAGMKYPEVVDLIKTKAVNAVYPGGRDLVILESIHFSYRFLQTLVDQNATNKKDKFSLLIEFLEIAQPWAAKQIAAQAIDQDKTADCPPCISRQEICQFVYRWFECLAKIIVLESGEGPTLPISGQLVLRPVQTAPPPPPAPIPKERPPAFLKAKENIGITPPAYQVLGILDADGTIREAPSSTIAMSASTSSGAAPSTASSATASSTTAPSTAIQAAPIIGHVGIDSKAYNTNGDLFVDQYAGQGDVLLMSLYNPLDSSSAYLSALVDTDGFLKWLDRERRQTVVRWNAVVDSCNIDTVRILHLDGTPLVPDEWDRMQRFIRLWKRLGWTIDEMDKALSGLWLAPVVASSPTTTDPASPTPDPIVTFDDFDLECCGQPDPDTETTKPCQHKDPCNCSGDVIPDDACKDVVYAQITPYFITELVSVKKLQDATSVELIKLLAFWADIDTSGDNSLYTRLFLTHNLVGIDPVFKPDADGNLFVTITKISAHMPVILAALHLKQDGLDAILQKTGLVDADLTLTNISIIYRYALLSQTLLVKVALLVEAISLLGDPFQNAEITLHFVKRFQGIGNEGFTIQQLTYAILGNDDPKRPLGPQKTTILKTTKTIFDGLNGIDTAHPDLTADALSALTLDIVSQNTSMVFDQPTVADINLLLAGTTPYTTNAPIGLTIKVPDALTQKVTYMDPTTAVGTNRRATLTVNGILTDAENAAVKALSTDSGWSKAVDRIDKKPLVFFNDTLFGIFPDQAGAIAALLSGDVIVTPEKLDPTQPDPNTAPVKEAYFMQYFLPYLRNQLANQLVISTMGGEAGISSTDITTALLTSIIQSADTPSKSALSILRGLQHPPSGASAEWTGYLIPTTTGAYTFVGFGDSQPAPLILDGQPIPFPYQQDDPNDVWSSDPVNLVGGKLYYLDAGGQSVPGLQWKTPTSPVANIPTASLLPDYSSQAATDVFVRLTKAAIIINGFALTLNEIDYLQSHTGDFGSFDLNNPIMNSWDRISAYTRLRNALPSQDSTLLDLFTWASTLPAGSSVTIDTLANKISAITQWVEADVLTLIGPNCLNISDPASYRNEITLVKLQKALTTAEKIAVDIPSLFKWADPMAKFWPSHAIAEDIRNAIRSQYSLDDWEQIVKPLSNDLRMKQRDALIGYLIVQPALIDWGVVDADSLFEFFLIDVQMGACLQTSRLKQAISTVQTFVQRCILGLELNNDPPIQNDALDQDRWQWMSKQTLWTANRKVYINCEDYIVESLRDDKSPLYTSLESELLQKDINPQALQDSVKNYLFGMDEIANLFVEGIFQDDNDVNNTIHFVGKKRSAPYLFFYRSYGGGFWAPWQPLPIDIATYHVDACDVPAVFDKPPDDKTRKQIYPAYQRPAADGSYVIPYMLGQRFLVFFVQMTVKSFARPALDAVQLTSANSVSEVQRLQTWEIKLGWTELRNGKWSPKQVTTDSILETPVTPLAPPQDGYRFIPTLSSEKIATGPSTFVNVDYINISVFGWQGNQIGGFEFHGSHAVVAAAPAMITFSYDPMTQFHHTVGTWGAPAIHPSYQSPTGTWDPTTRPYVNFPIESNLYPTLVVPHTSPNIPFCHEFSHELLSIVNATTDLGPLYQTYLDQVDTDGTAFGLTSSATDADGNTFSTYNELTSPYGLYNWEVGFHAPLELAESLLQNQQFENALKMCQYVFNPYADGSTPNRVWRWAPFKYVNTENTLEALFNGLKANAAQDPAAPDSINAWRNNPFAPHVVARGRPAAYMKFTVMKYLQILIAYGDYYFRQNTLEAVPLAIQCYILASHIYGPRGEQIPRRGKIQPQTYYSLQDKWDAFSNAVVEMELAFPFSNQTTHPVEFLGNDVVLANIFGFATTHYFSIPDNPQLGALRDLIDDRLYKIRHCQDINGNAISLALWEPPIDPSLLVNAVAQGLSLSNFLNDLNSPMPNFRFVYLLQKAIELCTELKAFASSFLSLKEKRDSEALQLMRSTQESAIQTLIMEVRTLQLDEANKSLEALRASRSGPSFRYKYYTSLAGATQAALNETDSEYSEIALTINAPQADGDLLLSDPERNEMDESSAAKGVNDTIGAYESFSSAMFAFPKFGEKAEPWGLGVALQMCADNLGRAATAHARALKVDADTHSWNSTNSGRKATYIKQYQERIQAANVAGYELININTQMVTQNTRIAVAAQEIANQQKQIDNTAETLDFLTNKYTNDQLYGWLEGSVRTLLYQTYTMAYDMAKKAEAAYLFERGPQMSPFILFGYWDSSHEGLQSGERLYVALKRLEMAYQEDRGHDFEIVKPISIRQLNPYALFQLQQNGTCQLELPEVLFDMDFPGHYFRRIKSVQMTIPCIVGPYTTINCTLRLLSHQYRTVPTATDMNSYLPQTDGPDGRFQTINVPIDSIAVSTSQNDSGLFELNFRDERYLPFEGAGAISKWQLDLPTGFRQFDYSTMTDVILTVRYTSRNGGDKLKQPASDSVVAYIKSVEDLSQTQGLFAVFDLKSEFASDWARASPASSSTTTTNPRVINLKNLANRLPIFTSGRDSSKIIATDVSLLTQTGSLTADDFTLTTSPNMDDVTFQKEPMVGNLNVYSQSDVEAPIGNWVLNVGGSPTVPLMKIWMLVRPMSLGEEWEPNDFWATTEQ